MVSAGQGWWSEGGEGGKARRGREAALLGGVSGKQSSVQYLRAWGREK